MTTINGKIIIRSELDISPATILEIEQTLNNEIAIIINERYKAIMRVHLEMCGTVKASMPDMIIIDDPIKSENDISSEDQERTVEWYTKIRSGASEETVEHLEQLKNIARSATRKG